MSVAYPPEAPVSPPTRQPPAPPAPPYTPVAPEPMTGESSVPPPPVAPARPSGGVVGGLILIAVGVVVLLGSWFPGRGAWLFLGLSVAFLIARVMTGRPGYAVPAGILLGPAVSSGSRKPACSAARRRAGRSSSFSG